MWSGHPLQSRFLPDKAIDLMDEACSTVRVQLDSKPEALDTLERTRTRLQVRTTQGDGYHLAPHPPPSPPPSPPSLTPSL
ncbi:hypothetical protein, partial [Blastomonas fulva]|uniref:hypothetical protein n=1 Tax=Blastomonas fulva TaxID=1550728 RepID=UPI004034B9D1